MGERGLDRLVFDLSRIGDGEQRLSRGIHEDNGSIRIHGQDPGPYGRNDLRQEDWTAHGRFRSVSGNGRIGKSAQSLQLEEGWGTFAPALSMQGDVRAMPDLSRPNILSGGSANFVVTVNYSIKSISYEFLRFGLDFGNVGLISGTQ